MNKKVFTLMLIFIAFVSLTFVSASENDTVLSQSGDSEIMSVSNDNISLTSNEIIGNSMEPDNLLGADEIPTQISLERSADGLIEDNKITITATLTDMEGNPLKTKTVQPFVDGTTTGTRTTDENGQISVDVSRTSGFYYFQVKFLGQEGYAASNSELIELAFANNNALTDFVVRMILSDGVMNLTKDYKGYGSNKVVRKNASTGQVINNYVDLNLGIPITSNLVVNGNGHTIEVSGNYITKAFFDVNNCALTLNNLTLLNGYSQDSNSGLFVARTSATYNLNNVLISNCSSSGSIFAKYRWGQSPNFRINARNSLFINNVITYSVPIDPASLFYNGLSDSTFEQCLFINNTRLFTINMVYNLNIRNNIFLGNSVIFECSRDSMWEGGYITGNYWGTNDSSVINSIRPKGDDVYYTSFGSHTYLTVDGNSTFSEDDIQDYKIYFSGTYANRVPAYETVLTYTSAYSTINATDITITSNPTTVRVSPKTYGLETLVIDPDLYELNINITKSTKVNYNVTVDAPETEYSIPLVITVNVNDADGNPVTTTANITIDGTTTTINITDGIGTLSVNNLVPGNYDITTKIISNMANYRNTTIYSSTNITKGSLIITLSCNTTTSIAREILPLVIKTQNSIGNNRSATVNIMEDDVLVGTVTTDAEGNGIFNHRPEAGSHVYKVATLADEYWESSESNPLDIDVIEKIPTKLTISSDTEMITEIGQKAKITVRLTDGDNAPLAGAGIKLVVNDVVVDGADTNADGECEFEYTNTSGLYLIKAVYGGNLTHYDNSSEIIELIVSTGGNFFDLSILINATNDGGVLTLIRDFTFNETLDQDFVNGIPINKNITIKGRDYTVNALNKARVFNINQGTAVTIDGLNVVNAASKTRGGAIYFKGDTLTISNSNFENNTITLDVTAEEFNQVGGGAVYSLGALTVVNSTFSDNKVLVYNDAPIEFNGGGAIYAHNDINVYNSVFDSNRATLIKVLEDSESYTPYASSLYIDGTNATIRNSTFKNGLAGVGAVEFLSPDMGNISIYDSLFLNNSASRFGAMGILTKEGKIINTTFENNSANVCGAVLIQARDFLLSDSRFFNNSANHTSSALTLDWGENMIIEKSYFINNHAVDGGTISYSEAVDMTVRYNIFVNNTGNASGVYYDYQGSIDDRGNLNYDYWGNNTPYDANVFNEYIRKGYDYITLEIIGPNVTYTTIPTTYIIKFNGTNADKLPNLDTLIKALSDAGVDLDKSSITINGSGVNVVLTSDAVQNITLVVGPEYNVLNSLDIVVEQLIKKNYTSNITVTNNVYGKTAIVTVDILDENGDVADIDGFLTYSFNDKVLNATIENGKAQIPLSNLDAGDYYINFTYIATNLFYNDLTGNKTFDVSKVNATFTLDVNNATYGEDVIIKATPQRGLDGNFTFYIKDILNQTVPIELGEAKWTLKDFPAGNYTIIATYNGNNNYNPATLSKNFTISKAEPKIEISVNDVNYGDDIIAVVTGVNVTGNVTVTVNNKNYIVEILNNTGNVTIDKLNVGNYTAVVVFDGNANITGLTNETEFNVYKASANMTVDISESIAGHDTTITVKFRDDVDGSVTITVDGTPKEIPIENGVATLNLTDLAEGQHTVNITYSGNSNFNSSSFNTTFSTRSIASQINVTASDAVYGGKVTVTATVTSDATGDVEFTINNVTKTGTIKDGVASATFEGLNAGQYNVTAKYLGDTTYISSTNTTTVTVSKANSTVIIEVGEIKENENIVITFTVLGNATGNVTVEIPGLYSPRTRNLTDGVNVWTISPAYGNYTVKVTYNGDDNYLTSSNSTTFAAKYKSALDIVVSDAFIGDDYTVDVILNSTATGTVLITVDGVDYNRTLKNGKASVSLKNLTDGNHTVDVVYSGDANFYNATGSKTFEPKSIVSSINVTSADIVYGDDLVVTATVSEGATGNVTFTVNGTSKTVEIKNGIAEATFSRVNAGSHTITAKYLGDMQHTTATNTTDVVVSKAKSYVLIDISEIKDGENVIFRFALPSDATGVVTVEIPGLYTPRNRNITNGAASWTINPLNPGTYTLNVIYAGDNNYLNSSNSTTFIVKAKPALDIVVSDAFIGDDYTVEVILNNTATGTVLITVDDVDYNRTLKNGKASVTLKNLTDGNHTVDVVYSGDANFYNATGSKTFEPKSIVSSINVTASDIVYGNNLVVKATVSEGATGNVEFTVNGVTKTAAVKNGAAQVSFSNLNAESYKITAKYLGDRQYTSATNTTTAKVKKASSFVLIDVGEIKDGENVVIRFTLPSDATGNVTVEIPGLYTPRNRTITNGAASWTINPLKAGTYTLNVVYNGDKNYLASSNSTTFAAKSKPALDIVVSDAFIGDDYTVDVILNSTATGTVLITVDGVDYSRTLSKGKASITLKNLTAGNHTVDVVYSGDANFYNATGSKTFEPKSIVSSINVTAADIVYGDDLVVKATVTEGATGNVEFTVNGVTKTAAVKNGVAGVSFSGLNVGSYEVTAKYLGDRVHSSATNTTTAAVEKAGSFVLIDVGEIKDGENVVIRFTVPSDATGNVTVEIPGLYTPRNRTITNGAASWTIAPLKPGTYTLNVVYNGDKNYLASSNSTVLISKDYADIIIDVGETIVGHDAKIDVTLPNDATGSVVITVDGVKYNETLKGGKASVVISNITKGTHNVDVMYSGDKYYYSSSNSTTFEPKSLNSTIIVIASDIDYGKDLVVRAVVNEDATGTVIFTVNGEDKIVDVHQGFASATFANVNAGNYVVNAVYSGNDVYLSSSNTTSVRVNKVNSTIVIKVGEIKEGQNVVITFIASNKATGNITVEIPGLYSPRVRTLANNENRWTIAPLSAGLYEVKVSYGGDINYYGSSNSTYIDYNRVKTSLNVDVEVSKTKIRFNANLTAEDGQLITAWVNITIGDSKYRIPVYNGTGYLDIPRLNPGNYTFEAFYPGTRAIINSSDSGSFEVDKIFAVLNVPDVVKYYKGSERLYVYLKDSYNDPIANGTVVIYINGMEYSRNTDANGTASIALGLNSGLYDVTVVFDDKKYGSVNATSTVNIKPTVNGTDVVKVYRNGTQYYATFRDSQGNYLPDGTTVEFNINGVFYERKVSGDKGLARLNLNLEQGNYILTAMNPVTGENTANYITVISRLVENKDLTKYYRNDSQYTVKVLGDDGKAVGAGVTVTFNINGVFYQRQTNASGIAKLSINLNPGDYIITAEYGGCRVSNNVKVLPVLSAKDMAKKYGTSDPFVATLVDGQGRPYADQTVQFNINGVFYNRVTNNYGQARLNINLQPGQYIITSSYNGANIANKVTVTP